MVADDVRVGEGGIGLAIADRTSARYADAATPHVDKVFLTRPAEYSGRRLQ